ncbi:MAG TPA: tRNA (adenosine(37)-N6)-threonylcarbamoyltransferase complex dimerization subunit type 1 TsaB [Xanthomonadaceae bacterium]|nr:tRNA (adenosine(37)-N6)-threonylcarbamoyltransferase complex dimerization subunit type 1 TsaB [Xanthomonadaceae bacterium]
MKLLAFETATEACSVALWVDGEVHERYGLAPRRHAELALPWADVLLAGAGLDRRDLDAVACGRGPGAFTGVRLAVALTQGIALGLSLPAVGVSTLAALALDAGAAEGEHVLAAIDARMGEVYAAEFVRTADGVEAIGEERLAAPAALELPRPQRLHGVGSGFATAGGVLLSRLDGALVSVDAAALPRASAVARLAARIHEAGGGVDPARLEPAYLRDKVAFTLAERDRIR